jgi:hypothetical protein
MFETKPAQPMETELSGVPNKTIWLGLFGWAMAVEKAAVGFELWKKLLCAVRC